MTSLLIAISLSFDSFASSVSMGTKNKEDCLKTAFLIAVIFGVFQATMPLIGYVGGGYTKELIQGIDHWIAFFLLSGVGIKFIVDAVKNKEKEIEKINLITIIILGIATSIDALVVGITFNFIQVNLIFTILVIGIITFLASITGFFIGLKFGNIKSSKIEILGGLILITIGLKILMSHLA